MHSPETQSYIAQLRSKAALGTLTMEEMREAVRLLRQDRVGAQAASAASKAKSAKSAPRSADDLLDELMGKPS